MKAYICNTGIISAIGLNTEENRQSLLNKKKGISLPTFVQTRHELPVGEIKISNDDLASKFQIPEEWPRTTKLSCIAAAEAWAPYKNKSEGLRIALLSANTVGGMDKSELSYLQFSKEEENFKNFDEFKLHECGTAAELTALHLGLDCFVATISTACSSSANTIMMGAKMIAQDKYDVVLAGGADSLSQFTINGFNSLMILDKEECRPYSADRKGLNIGEGAAYVLLANEKAMKQWNQKSDIFVSGYANANDAHHQTASSPDGIGNQLAMKNALNKANLEPNEIDYINLHGTGTENNDLSEGIAIQHVFGNNVPSASSTKMQTGHTLGAAGAIEAVYSYLSLQEQQTWPHWDLAVPMPEINWQPNLISQKKIIRNVMSNSFGFGGNCSSIILSKV